MRGGRGHEIEIHGRDRGIFVDVVGGGEVEMIQDAGMRIKIK